MSAANHDGAPRATHDAMLVDRYAQLSRAYVERGEGRLAQLAMCASDVHALQALLWENGLDLAPDPDAALAGIGEAVLGSLDASAGDGDGLTPRLAVERSRAAMVATFDDSVHALLSERFGSVDHLDTLAAPQTPDTEDATPQTPDTEDAAARRLDGRTPEELVRALRVTAADCIAIAEMLHGEGDAAAAVRQAWQADIASFEAYLLTAAVLGGDTRLATVDLRWDLAASLVPVPTGETTDELTQVVTAWRDRLAEIVGSVEAPALRAMFEPVPGA